MIAECRCAAGQGSRRAVKALPLRSSAYQLHCKPNDPPIVLVAPDSSVSSEANRLTCRPTLYCIAARITAALLTTGLPAEVKPASGSSAKLRVTSRLGRKSCSQAIRTKGVRTMSSRGCHLVSNCAPR